MILDDANFDVKENKFSFFGKGGDFFVLCLKNIVLCVITLGIYIPWAITDYRKFFAENTEFRGKRFQYTGKGKELLKGFLIGIAILIAFQGIMALLGSLGKAELLFIPAVLFYIGLFIAMPYIIISSNRYFAAKTKWNDVSFGFSGEVKEFSKFYYKDLLLTIVTFGIYGPWMMVNVVKYLHSKSNFGHLKFSFNGEGAKYFVLMLVGVLLSYITFFLYLPVFMKKRYNFFIENTSVSDGEKTYAMSSSLTNGEAFKVGILNFLLVIVTFGIGYPWAIMNMTKLFLGNTSINGDFDFESITESGAEYSNATGDAATQLLEVEIGL